jgi:hypothetical protein
MRGSFPPACARGRGIICGVAANEVFGASRPSRVTGSYEITHSGAGEIKDKITLDSCTMLVKNGDMGLKRSKVRKSSPTGTMVRLTVSLPKAVLSRVNIIADQMEVSAGWVIRKAVIEFVNRDIPLFRSEEKF